MSDIITGIEYHEGVLFPKLVLCEDENGNTIYIEADNLGGVTFFTEK